MFSFKYLEQGLDFTKVITRVKMGKDLSYEI